MNDPPRVGLAALTDKEKQTLRLIVRGYDAKSAARRLDLSVHTINGRLRDARRKLAVPSSREAARLLLEAEGESANPATPYLLAGDQIGAEPKQGPDEEGDAPIAGAAFGARRTAIFTGVLTMSIALALLALTALPHADTAPFPAITAQTADNEAVQAARMFLELLDHDNWNESYAATGAAFHKQNTLQAWTAASEKVRAPLGPATSRHFVSAEEVPAPPNGYELVKFQTIFANRNEPAVETVTLAHEDGVWRVTGVTID